MTGALTSEPTAFEHARVEQEVVTMRRARDRAFRQRVLGFYDWQCAVSRRRLVSPLSPTTAGIDAAHIVPVKYDGSDHPANGIPLTKELHWAFDRGMLGISEDRNVIVPQSVAEIPGNEFLASLQGNALLEASEPNARALDEAFAWHRTNVLIS